MKRIILAFLAMILLAIGIQAQDIPNLPVVTNKVGEGWVEIEDRQLAVKYMKEMLRLTGRKPKNFPRDLPTKAWALLPLVNQLQIQHPELPDWAHDPKPTYSGVVVQWKDETVGWAAFLAKDVSIPTRDGDRNYKFEVRYGKYDPGANYLLWKREPGFDYHGGRAQSITDTDDEVFDTSFKAAWGHNIEVSTTLKMLSQLVWRKSRQEK